jgi:hypothetical protein
VSFKKASLNLIYRKFTLAGTPLGSWRTLVPGSSFQDANLVADTYDIHFLPNGNLVVAWNEGIPFTNDRNLVREFDGTGVPIGPAASFEEESDKTIDLEIDGTTNDQVFITWESFPPGFPSDGNNIFVRRVRIGNAPPMVKGDPNWLDRSYFFGESPPVDVGRTVTVSDADSSNLNGHTLRVRISQGGHSSNRLVFSGNGIVVNSGVISVDGIAIGTFISDAGVGSKPFDVKLNAGATTARVQKLIRNLRFRTTSAAYIVQRRIDISIADASGLTSSVRSVFVDIFT